LLIEKVHDYFNNVTRRSYNASENTKLLIPGYLVTKIIGAKGCMIREIAARSGGTQIKILSDKSAERDLPEIAVSIAGSLKGKQEASAIILEQIELFKNGGPVLTTGSCLNENIANQYKNSVQRHESAVVKPEKDRKRSRYSSSESSKRRSRSSSLEERYIKRKDSDPRISLDTKNSITMTEVYQIRAQLNAEFMNKRIPALEINTPVQRKIIQEHHPLREIPKKETLPILSNSKPYFEDEVRILDLEIQKKPSQVLEIAAAPTLTPMLAPIIAPILAPVPIPILAHVEVPPIIRPPTFKLTLLMEDYSEASRFKDALERHNRLKTEHIEFKSNDLGFGKGITFVLSSNPSTIAEIIKIHGNIEIRA
jgi:hypothetical protein